MPSPPALRLPLEIEDIKAILPHRYPFLLVDRILEIEEDRRVLGLKNVAASGWFGFFAPPNTPKAVIDTLNRGINKALTSPDVVERLTKLGMDPATSTPEGFAMIVATDYAKWGPIVKASGFTAD